MLTLTLTLGAISRENLRVTEHKTEIRMKKMMGLMLIATLVGSASADIFTEDFSTGWDTAVAAKIEDNANWNGVNNLGSFLVSNGVARLDSNYRGARYTGASVSGLAVGETVTISLDVRFNNVLLFNHNGYFAGLSANTVEKSAGVYSKDDAATDNLLGYSLRPRANENVELRLPPTSATLASYTYADFGLTGATDVVAADSDTWITMIYSATKSAVVGQFDVAMSMDGGAPTQGVISNQVAYDADELWFQMYHTNVGANLNGTEFDNISVAVIPEPATFGLLGLGALGVFIARRRLYA